MIFSSFQNKYEELRPVQHFESSMCTTVPTCSVHEQHCGKIGTLFQSTAKTEFVIDEDVDLSAVVLGEILDGGIGEAVVQGPWSPLLELALALEEDDRFDWDASSLKFIVSHLRRYLQFSTRKYFLTSAEKCF